MKHIVLSDTHAPDCILKIYNHLKETQLYKDADAIVINGDILGTFSMFKSSRYKLTQLGSQEYSRLLMEGAPNFFTKLETTITQELVQEYVKERYEWCFDIIKKFSELHRTVFNYGNHESEHQMLVINEISTLIGNIQIDYESLKFYARDFDKKLIELEKTNTFHYIRHKPIIINKTMILGIPGESHDPYDPIQEEKTRQILSIAKANIDKINFLVIYNHTQGNYNKNEGSFWCVSESLSDFMKNLPINVFRKIFIQSHNHWSHSQFMRVNDFNIILNNAGLHDGIYNILEFNTLGVECKDIDPTNNTISELTMCTELSPVKSDLEIIKRYYKNHKYILERKQGKLAKKN